MSEQKKGLGRGLSALLGEAPRPAEEAQGRRDSVREVDIGQIRPNPAQPRQHFDEDALAELADSIRQHGALQPVLLRPVEGGYELIAGERRWRASQRVQLHTIPALVRPILEGRADIVTGTKQGKYEKAFVSAIYNRLCRALFGVRVTDLNSVKAYRREVVADVPVRPDWHRFMVVIAAADGFRLMSHPVPLHPRKAGVSKFTWRRIPVGVLDLLSVWFQLRFGRKPMLFFGVLGATLFALGFLAGIVALVIRFGFGIGFRPLLNLVETMVISGIALFGFGFVGELVAGMREEQREMSRAISRIGRDQGP